MEKSSDSKRIDTLTGIWVIIIAGAILTAAAVHRYEKRNVVMKQSLQRIHQENAK